MNMAEFNRDNEYWNTFYQKNPPATMKESFFARFIQKYLEKGKKIVDIGCGNGRDSIFFGSLGLDVIGVDASGTAISALNKMISQNISFVCGNFVNEEKIYSKNADYYYSRFTLHAIDEKEEEMLIKNVYRSLNPSGKFFIEVRGVHDEKFGRGEKVARNAYILDGHYRRFIVINELILKLISAGFSIKYAEEEKGFAPYGTEDPKMIRIVAVKISDKTSMIKQKLGGGQTPR